MNYYPLLETDKHQGFVSLANFPPTEKWRPVLTYVYAAQSNGDKWLIYPCGHLAPGQTRRFNRSSNSFAAGTSIFFFMSQNKTLPKELLELPSPNKYQFANPSWRGTLGLTGNNMEAAYSGEYPDDMLPLAKSSCVSLSPLLQLSADIRTAILFVNMISKPGQSIYPARLIHAATKSVLQEWKISSNRVNQCNVSPEIANKIGSNLAHFVVDGVTGVPIYFSSNESTGGMSLEHSHPPVEFLVFGESVARTKLVRSIKKVWLSCK
jgi:hypothetical protein